MAVRPSSGSPEGVNLGGPAEDRDGASAYFRLKGGYSLRRK